MRTTTIFTNDSTQTSTQCQWHDNDRVGRMEVDAEMSELCTMTNELMLTL
ncbi:hypothetical protein K2Y11_06500 [bacterium]|nr:hypothetical protein [bacterium]